ncbi:MAG: hypothetical protein QOG38_41 [Hyphomicrobiales bacterium]|nr:hypothetical protein [Hyphomicrobiales bacterium]
MTSGMGKAPVDSCAVVCARTFFAHYAHLAPPSSGAIQFAGLVRQGQMLRERQHSFLCY